MFEFGFKLLRNRVPNYIPESLQHEIHHLRLSLAAPSKPIPPVLPPPKHASSELIFGGHRAYQGHFPYFARISGCGGSLITPKHILTAAHCVDQSSVGDDVIMGLDEKYNYESVDGVQMRKIAAVSTHVHYNGTTYQNDIAILEVDQPFEITNYVQVVEIKADDAELQKRHWTTVVGFGPVDIVNNTLVYQKYLQYAYVPIADRAQCCKIWCYWGLSDKQICGGAAGVGTGPGDSGGPMAVRDADKYFQIGVVSYGVRRSAALLHQDKYPSVYIRTASYCDWMSEKTDGAFRCI
ncbi:hypothetical protein QR680_011493 [Steinernema hermaphroditum]|uniref:Peptidase S1 domain-containing protein n=1 Tax=Steinernema hermaphroditum TaxID=289476 RepID=A0AA39LY65_9BILA|nr:hypothetical protein QR680_011493 [Steinernema hermaphroditum]